MNLPLVDLSSQHRSIREEIDAAIARVIDGSAFILGGETEAFEEEFAAFCDVPYAVACGNGTDALELALAGAGIKQGDEVVTVSQTFAATGEAIVRAGGRVRFADIDPETLLMDVAAIEPLLTDRTRAVVPVHLYGSCVDMTGLGRLAAARGLIVVEDAAQAHGALTNTGARAGADGLAGCFSFYPSKNLGAIGDAGMVVTSDPALAAWLRQARDHGRVGKYGHDFVGRNSRMDGIQAAVLRVKLRHLAAWNQRRRELAMAYDERFAGTVVRMVAVPDGCQPVHHLLVVRVPDRSAVRRHLAEHGISTGIHYPIPLHRQDAFAASTAPFDAERLVITESVSSEILSLPIFPEMSETDVDRVAETLLDAVASAARP